MFAGAQACGGQLEEKMVMAAGAIHGTGVVVMVAAEEEGVIRCI